MSDYKLNRLSQEVVNQIAAGEVIERPSSVVKELVDNSIDAEATSITIKLKNGGINLIEVSDDGFGIPKENMERVFEAHTTSKMKSIEDLNNLLSMGFRGEALSTITSIARVKLLSKFKSEEIANQISYLEGVRSPVSSVAKEKGTTVSVEELFYNIPARKKYLKSATTEFRKIYDILTRYFLIYPNIHFVLEKDSKKVDDLPVINGKMKGEITMERTKAVLGEAFAESSLPLKYEGSGIKISGYIAHPSSHRSKGGSTYIFVNNRGVSDRGITRAVYEGYSRYLPFGEKISFVLNIIIEPQFVDVNVHPRKEEVRFENPFRLYSAIEEAVRHTLEKELSYKNVGQAPAEIAMLRERYNNKSGSTILNSGSGKIYTKPTSKSIEDSLLFSKEALSSLPFEEHNFDSIQSTSVINTAGISSIFQIFNKYIVVEFQDEKLWIIDQHAAAERINFEKLSDREKSNQNLQNLLVPNEISFGKQEILFLEESKEFFQELGFIYSVKGNSIYISTVPAEFAESDFEKIFSEIFDLEENLEVLGKNLKKKKDDILATIACHGSVRSGQKLSHEEMLNLFNELKECNNPYSCPHGRPAIWKLTIEEIDHNFERTY